MHSVEPSERSPHLDAHASSGWDGTGLDTISPGRILGDYCIEGKLAEGAMGRVYAAWDTRLERPAALKMLHTGRYLDEDTYRRLLVEAKAVSALNHPNIVTIYGILEADDLTFIAMERLQGQTLAASIPVNGLPIDRVLEYAQGAAKGLAHAHRAGMIHRDIKPNNTMITADGQVKLLDFGLARFGTWQDEASEGLVPAGTLPYMSPEQIRGDRLDARSDVFSLGVMIYEMTAGRRPFAAANKDELIRGLCYETPEHLMDLREDLPADFAPLVEQCLTKDPESRPKHAGEVATAIERIREVARTAGVNQKLRRGRVLAWSLSVAMVAVLLLALSLPGSGSSLPATVRSLSRFAHGKSQRRCQSGCL